MNAKEVYSLYNQNTKVVDKSLDQYYSENIPYINNAGVNTYDIANSFNIPANEANDKYNNYDELEMFKDMGEAIVDRLEEVENKGFIQSIVDDVIVYFGLLFEKIRKVVDYYKNEIDNFYFSKNLPDYEENHTYKQPSRNHDEEQESLFDEDFKQSEIVNEVKKEKAKNNKTIRARAIANKLLKEQEISNYHQKNQFKLL
ncbi:hypothetical protein [Francisella marina]|uniref:Uncharacterized protein n=1 Tax=Francisella marina TaxID=2249302 RepID=A0ABX5ZGU1_9GAMM|nr:hypothetical protein [Francisella marina]QEO57577.1 hypothetical protein F0R74_06815 [Francisella marina]